jgi:hypothetical protein
MPLGFRSRNGSAGPKGLVTASTAPQRGVTEGGALSPSICAVLSRCSKPAYALNVPLGNMPPGAAVPLRPRPATLASAQVWISRNPRALE